MWPRAAVTALLALALLAVPALAGWEEPAAAVRAGVDDFSFDSFAADYTLDLDTSGRAVMRVVETIVAVFPENQNRGIIRAIPIKDGDVPLGNLFSQELDEVHAKFKNRERPVRLGFQFRLIEEIEPATEGVNGRPGRPPVQQVVNMSYPIDWLAGDENDPDDVGSTPTGAQFSQYVNDYVDYIWGAEDGSTQPAFPAERLEKMRFEITTYKFYKAGDAKFNDRMLVPEPEPGSYVNRLYQLGNTPTRYSFEDDYVQGKNLAVREYHP